MLSRYEHGGITWVDLESPTRPEVQRVVEEFRLNHFVGEELLLPTTKPRVEVYSDHLYTILHFPALRHSHKTLEQEIDFVIGRNFLITTRYETIDPLHKFSKVFEVDSVLDTEMNDDHAGYLFFSMLRRLYRSVENELDFVRSDMAHIEKHIFSDHELEMVKQISRSARDLLNLRQTIEPHRDVLRELQAAIVPFFGDSYASFARTIENDYYRLHNHIMRSIESLHELRETNNSLLSTKENETMRVLTIMALLTFPLTLLVAIFSVEADHNPIRGLAYDFWIIVGTVGLCGALMLAYFKHRHWL